MNICQAGHEKHQRRLVQADAGAFSFKMQIFDWDSYDHVVGYCTGKDDISRTLWNEHTWERDETGIINQILGTGDRNKVVLDFGSHIGWYSLLAAAHGYQVFAYDGDAENLELLKINAEQNKLTDRIEATYAWVDGNFPPLPNDIQVELLKVDIEGNEEYAVVACKDLFQNRQIEYAVIEVTPTFNTSYPDMVKFIRECGYDAFEIKNNLGLEPFDHTDYNFIQKNLLFRASE